MDDFQHLDDFALLGVAPHASPEEIKQAYRREIAKYHPDRFRTADPQTQHYARERSQRLTEAYATLNRAARPRRSPTTTFPTTSAEDLAATYARAQASLAAGDTASAIRLLQQIQKVDPFYRDVDDLLAQAMSHASVTTRRGLPLVAWLGGGLLALLLAGGLYGAGAFRTETAAERTPNPAASVVVAESSRSASPTPASGTAVVADGNTGASSPAASANAGSEGAAVGDVNTPTPAQTSTTTASPTVEILPSSAPPTEEALPTATIVLPTQAAPPTSSPTDVPAPTRGAVALEGGQVLAVDNFNDGKSGWADLQQTAYTLGHRDGGYAITAQRGAGAIFAFGSPLQQSNVVIGADVTPIRGAAGLIFGPDNSYRFVVSGGTFRVEQRGRVIVPNTASRALGRGTNRLSIAAVGRRASLYANSTLLANLDLPAPLAGTTYGFVTIPGPNGGEGFFDNLTVRTIPR